MARRSGRRAASDALRLQAAQAKREAEVKSLPFSVTRRRR